MKNIRTTSNSASVPPPLARIESDRLRALVRDGSERKETKTFVIEGPHLLERALQTNAAAIQAVYMTATAAAKYPSLQLAVTKHSLAYYQLSEKQSEKISDTKTPQGIFALISMSQSASKNGHTYIALDGVQDPGNVGTIIRAAAWFGVPSVLIGSGSADPYSPKVIRATQGEIFSVNCEISAALEGSLKQKQAAGYEILTTTLEPAACSIYKETFKQKHVIVLGNEASGVSAEIAALADRQITIPKAGVGESLNVAMSAAVILSEVSRRRQP